eukprot:3119854-Prymnesium_polylepis.1
MAQTVVFPQPTHRHTDHRARHTPPEHSCSPCPAMRPSTLTLSAALQVLIQGLNEPHSARVCGRALDHPRFQHKVNLP